MFQKMRRADRQISAEEAQAVLQSAQYGILSTTDPDGRPYGVPLTFAASGDKLYFHCALDTGHKVENLRQNPNVCFTVVGNTEPMPEKFATLFESVIVFGAARELFDEEKRAGLVKLIEKYSADYREAGMVYIEKLFHKAAVYEITMEHVTGKARRRETPHNLDVLNKETMETVRKTAE